MDFPNRLVYKKHIKPDTLDGKHCALLCWKASQLRNKAIDSIKDYYDTFEILSVDDETAYQYGMPDLGVDKYGNQKHYGGKIWSLRNSFRLVGDSGEYRDFGQTKIATQVLKQISAEWSGWWESRNDYFDNPHKYKAMPQPPKKKNARGQYPVGFSAEAISFRAHEGYLTLAGCEIELPDLCPYPFLNANGEFDPKRNYGHALHVTISPSRYGYWIHVVYANAGAIPDISASHTKVAGSDVGVDPLFTISSNDPSTRAAMVGGGEAIYYLRKWGHARAKIQSELPKGVFTSKKLEMLDQKHLNRMETLGHTVSKRMVEWCLENGVGTIVMANNPGWKQRVKLGRHTNRRFHGIPHQNMRSKIEYKAILRGIDYREVEESYTSQASFLDGDIPSKPKKGCEMSGRRVARGLYITKSGKSVQADHNASLNMPWKEFGKDIFDADRSKYFTSPPRTLRLNKPYRRSA